MTTPQAGIEINDPQAYQAKLWKLLGGRDPLTVLAQTPDILDTIVSRHSAAALRTRPFAGKWTPNEVLGHLTDTEWVYGFRVRHILSEDNPTLIGMNQELWVTAQRHNEREPRELAAIFRGLRSFNLATWRGMRPADLKRTGRHAERGLESLELMLRMEAGHDLSHIDQITRYLAAIPPS